MPLVTVIIKIHRQLRLTEVGFSPRAIFTLDEGGYRIWEVRKSNAYGRYSGVSHQGATASAMARQELRCDQSTPRPACDASGRLQHVYVINLNSAS